ncbi:MAG: hypothetical protein KY451_14455, partial [Actinobacteria bacterium]|nr:hypothetical protein [Actinomycetota bacterium]
MLILEVGANTSLHDLIRQQVSASCAVPTAASWAVALGAISGAVLAVTATAVATRLRWVAFFDVVRTSSTRPPRRQMTCRRKRPEAML